MRLLQIQNGISIDVGKIEGIMADGKTCKIHIGSHTYKTIYSYETFLSLLKRLEIVGTSEDRTNTGSINEVIRKLNLTLDKSQHFVG